MTTRKTLPCLYASQDAGRPVACVGSCEHDCVYLRAKEDDARDLHDEIVCSQ